MPSEIMDQRSSTGSHFFEDVRFSTERQFGFWKTPTMADNQVGKDGLVSITGSKLPVEKRSPNGMLPVSREELAHSILAREGKSKIPIGERSPVMSNSSINCVDNDPNSRSSFSALPASHSLGGTNGYGTQWESSLFSSSFSDIFSKKLQLSGNDVKALEPKNTATSFQDEELFESLEEIEAQTIGNLLPAEDDLFSGVTSDLGCKAHGNNADELEDFDLFSSSGGMELEGDDRLNGGRRNPDFFGGAPGDQGSANGSVIGVHPNGEHPSRTLFVRNINSNVEDSELKSLFEQYGDIQTLYTACKHRGFVMISYYDTRAARNAMSALQNKPLRRRKLDIHYSIPKDNPSDKDANQGALLISNLDPSVTKDELHKIFSAYGEIKEIRDAQHKSHQKCIEYYDIRAAEAALSALNRSCIAGKQIELEHSHSGGSRWLMEQPDQELEESHRFNNFDDYLSRQMAAISPGIISSGCMDNGSSHVRHSVTQSPSGTFIENHWSSSVHSNITSPVPVVSISKQYGLNEHHINMDNIKFNNQCLPSFHPHSLPDYHDGLVNGIPYTSSSIGSMACNIGSGVTEAVNNRRVSVGSNGHPMEFKGGVFGSAGNGTGPLPGHHYMWNNSNIGHQQSSSRMIWSNSQSFVNGIHPHHLPQMTGFPRAPSVMMNAAPALHHVGSAPAVNPSIWERRHAFSGESPDASSFYLGSTASVGFSGSSPSHPLEVASRNILSPSVGNFVDMTRKAGMRSPQQMSLMFPGRSTIISMPSSFDSPSERMRSISQRRTDSNGNHFDKKQYELDLERILRGDDNRTTLMIKNIPNKYTSKMLLAAIDEYCRGTYDFIYLPIDFKNKCNVGYAFINMVEPQQIIPFHKAFNGKKWEKFNSEKVASLAYARIQGKAALVAHFQNSSLMNEDKRCRPILFHTDGPNAGDPEPFPMGTNIRSRPGKHRASNNDDNHLNGNHSILVNGEDSSNGTDSSSSSD